MILFIIVYLIYLIYASMEVMHMLQQNLYNENNRYLKWIKNNAKKVFSLFDLVPLIFVCVIFFVTEKEMIDFLLIASMFVYLFNLYREVENNKASQNKIPLKATGRIKRLFLTNILIYGVVIFFAYKYSISHDYKIEAIFLVGLVLMIFLKYFVIFIANLLNAPFNSLVYYYYFRKAKKKLKEQADLQVVGITGSYGKTSSKNILSDILSSKYITRATPKNYNTPYGLMLTINNHLDKFDEILIAEMGAYTKGRIKNLCDFVHPKYGILTVIGEAHLETFKTRENIQKTKFELIESLPHDGVAILNMDDPYQVSYKLKNQVMVKWIAIDNRDADVYATDVKFDNKGMNFICHYGDNKEIKLSTRLLGKHNVYNILASVALGKKMGMSITELQTGVRKVRPVEHRLEIKNLGGMYMIDDAYNSNPVGAESALKVLDMMPGVKIVVTPGMIELGDKEDEYNKEFGKQISKVADYVILVGEKKTKPIYDGLVEKGFDKEKIIVLNDVRKAYTFVTDVAKSNEVYALFENDLPDTFNE